MATTSSFSRKRSKSSVPLLYPGDRLSQREFHRRYEAYPDPKVHFELIGGIVYMNVRAGFEHSSEGFRLIGVLNVYQAHTPGVRGAIGPTVILGPESEPEPDTALIIAPEYEGQTTFKRIKNKVYIHGPPELVLEVAHSPVAIDLHGKLEVYRQAGVREYIVICLDERDVFWSDLAGKGELAIDSDGVLRSRAFPGLWIDTEAIWSNDDLRLLETGNKGIGTKEHQAFVASLQKRRKPPSRPSSPKKNGKPRKRD
jgi:Uma2 family endonuclease